ncbi:MAG: hypothetical protein VX466_05405 [Myxococcota bacterium]|nr:hypothetical protein [Myxococcota bacterium]
MNKRVVDRLAVATAGILLAFVGYHLLRRGINLSDEGFLLQQSVDMLAGKILYRDIEMFIAPGIWFLVAGLFQLVEPSVLASRAIAAVSYFALALVSFRLVRSQVGGRTGLHAGAICVAVYAVLAVWSFPHWTWAWYSPWSILFALLALQCVLSWREDRRNLWLFLAGACIGLTAIFKQNYGLFALAGCGLSVVVLRIEKREAWGALGRAAVFDGLRMGGGLALAILPLLVYFGIHGALYSIYDRFFLYPLEFTTAANIPYLPLSAIFDASLFADRVSSTHYLSQLALSTPTGITLLPAAGTIHLLHALLYWAPPAILLAGTVLSFRRREQGVAIDGPLLASTLLSGFLFLGVFPRADFTHLVTVYQPLLVTGALVWHRASQRLGSPVPRWAWLPVAGGVAAFGFYALAAAAWLNYLVTGMTDRLPQPRGGVLVQRISAVGINQLVEVVRAHTEKGEAFFGIPDMAMINFLSERPVPGSQYQTYAHMISRDRGALTTAQLDAAGVDFAIARYDNVLSSEPRLSRYAPLLADYLARHFEPTWMIQNDQYLLLERRQTPLAPVVSQEVLGDCEFAGGDARPSSVREHLFFASLFQPLRPDAPSQNAETRCRLRVPQDATLAVQIGYKRPIGIERGASLSGEILALVPGREPERLLRESWPVRPMSVDGVPFPKTHRVDVSHLGGSDVTLVFRTQRQGRVRLSPFTLETYGMFWQNPVLEQP